MIVDTNAFLYRLRITRCLLCFLFCGIAVNSMAQQPELVVPVPHTSFVNKTAYSSDGRLIATASQDNTAKVWDAFTGELLFTGNHKASVEDVIFSRNNQLLLTVSKDSTACIWNLATRSVLHTLKGHTAEVVSGAFGAGDSVVLTGARENMAILWRVKDGSIIKKMRVYEYDAYMEGNSAVFQVSFNKSGTRFLTGDFSGKCILWDSRTKDSIRSFVSLGNYIKVARFSADEKYIVAIEWSGFDAYIWEVATGKLVNRFHSDDAFQEYASLSADNTMLLTAYTDKVAALYHVASGDLIRLFTHPDNIKDGVITKGGKNIVTASSDGTVKIWETATGNLLHELGKEEKQIVLRVSLSPDQRYCVTAAQNHSVKVWDIQKGNLFRDLNFTGYSNKNGSYFIANNKIAVSYDAYQTIFNIRNIRAENEMRAWNMDWSIKHQGKYIIRQSNINYRQPLTVYTKEMEPVLTISNYKYPHQESNTGRFLFSNTLGNSGYLYSLPAGKVLYRLTDNTEWSIISTAFSADDSLVAAGTLDGSIQVWETATGKQVFQADVPKGVTNICITKDKSQLLVATKNQLYWWSLKTTQLIRNQAVGSERLDDIALSEDDALIVTAAADRKVMVHTFSGGTLIGSLDHKPFENGISSVLIKDLIGRTVVSSISSTDILWDVKGEILQYNGIAAKGGNLIFSKDKKLAVFCTPQIVVWDLDKRKILSVMEYGWTVYERIYDARLSPDGKQLVLFSYFRTMLVDTYSGKLITDFPEIKTRVVSAWFDATGKNLLLATNGFDYVYDVASLKWQYAYLTRKDKNYLVITPDGYYSGSAGVAKQLHYVTNGLSTISFKQLDVRYNRPDKVLEATGSKDTLLINSYRKAYLKRIKKLGIDTTVFTDGYKAPSLVVANRTAIAYEQTNRQLGITINAKSGKARLTRLHVLVNDVPFFGAKGIAISSRRGQQLDTAIRVTLSAGENRIEVSVTDAAGMESYRMPVVVKYVPVQPPKEQVHFIGIGINHFATPSYNLNWSVKDIRDLAAAFREKFPGIIIDTLFDSNVTRENILTLKNKLLQLDVDDKVIVSYSGHGVLGKELDYYLSTYQIDFNQPETAGLAYEEIERLLDGIKPRQKLLLLDACHSGELDKDEIERIQVKGNGLDSMGTTIDTTTRSSIKVKQKIGMHNSFQLMQTLFVNISQGTGTTIISAAGGMQYAQERGDLKNGVFTYCILDACRNNQHLTVSQLQQLVSENVVRLTNGLQQPTSRTETSNFDWRIW